jgi:8-oxo-dGTP pyrophosphatase MutT (NUDIX family)
MSANLSRPTVIIDGVVWEISGAQVAIVHEGKILVQLRPWPPGWELPGGHCENDEDPQAAARREAEEETGYHIQILGIVGVYSLTGIRNLGDVLYLAEIIGGKPRRNIESLKLRWVTAESMPKTLFPWCRERIYDALARIEGAPPVHREQPITIYHIASFATAWLRTPLDAWRKWRAQNKN